MNRLHSWKICAGMATALLLFTACSQDELTEQGTPLPVGQYPLELTADGVAVATSAQPATRGTFFEGDWNSVTGVRVRVNDKEEKEYSVTPSEDKKTARLAPAEPLGLDDNLFWWNSTTDEKTITAWAPYEYALNEKFTFPTEWKKEHLDKFDIIGVKQTIDFENRNESLVFRHLMAKVVINLRETEYLKAAKDVKVKLLNRYGTGLMEINMYTKEFGVTYGDNTLINTIPYLLPKEDYKEVNFGNRLEKPLASYTALVVPVNQVSIEVLQIEVDNAKYILLQESFTDELFVPYKAGQVTTFNVTVKENGLNVTVGESIGWGTDGATGSGEVELP